MREKSLSKIHYIVFSISILICIFIGFMLVTARDTSQVDQNSLQREVRKIEEQQNLEEISTYQLVAGVNDKEVLLSGNTEGVMANEGMQVNPMQEPIIISTADVNQKIEEHSDEEIEQVLKAFQVCYEKYKTTPEETFMQVENPTDIQIFQDKQGIWNMLIRNALDVVNQSMVKTMLIKYIDDELIEEDLWYSQDIIVGRDYEGVMNKLDYNTQSDYYSLYEMGVQPTQVTIGAISDEEKYAYFVYQDASLEDQYEGYAGNEKLVLEREEFFSRFGEACVAHGVYMNDASMNEPYWSTDVYAAYYYWIINGLAEE